MNEETTMTTDAPIKKLFAALVVAQRAAKSVTKDSHNEHHHYSYASAESVIEVARAALGEAGLALMATTWRFVERPQGDPSAAGAVHVTYRLVHGESGESEDFKSEWFVVEERGRPLDRAVAIALTANLAYFLRGLLLLPRPDDEEGRATRRERPAQAPAGDGPPALGGVIPGGRTKGTPIARASNDDLAYWTKRIADDLEKGPARQGARELLSAMREEVARREAAARAAPAKPPPVNDTSHEK
jgi:hypothetical protein